jgi:hypothetical protein
MGFGSPIAATSLHAHMAFQGDVRRREKQVFLTRLFRISQSIKMEYGESMITPYSDLPVKQNNFVMALRTAMIEIRK